jgi:hypothetical protein
VRACVCVCVCVCVCAFEQQLTYAQNLGGCRVVIIETLVNFIMDPSLLN